MKKFLIAASALTAALTASAGIASAAPFDGRSDYGRNDWRPAAYSNANINQRQRDLSLRIEQGQRNGGLTYREARTLREDLRQIERLEIRYRRDGMSRWEVTDLDRRLDVLTQKVRFNRNDNDRRYNDRRDRW